jgi:hypothetical protein
MMTYNSNDISLRKGIVHLRLGHISLGPIQIGLVLIISAILAIIFFDILFLPNPLLKSGDAPERWNFYDKRSMIFSYLSAVGLLIFIRFVSPRTPKPASKIEPNSLCTRLLQKPASRHRSWNRLCCLGLGFLLGLVLFSGDIFSNLSRFDSHLDVQLGALEAIRDGKLPYVAAETQYGPGNQILLYHLMKQIDFSYWGALQAQAVVNSIVVAAFCGILLWFYGPLLGLISILLLAVFPSPIFVAAFPGWGWLTRWVGPALLSLFLAEILFAPFKLRRELLLLVLGALWGIFSFLSQESFATGLMLFFVILGLAAGIRVVSYCQFVSYAVCIVASGMIMFSLLTAILVGVSDHSDLIQMYFLAPSRVFNGMTNRPWTQYHWQDAAEALVYHVSYVLLPVMVGLISMYMPLPFSAEEKHRQKLLLGTVGGAVSLAVPTFFRADTSHLWGPSFLLGSCFLLGTIILPRALSINRTAKLCVSAMFGTVLILAVITKMSSGKFLIPRSPTIAVAAALEMIKAPERQGELEPDHHDGALAFVLKRISSQPDHRKLLMDAKPLFGQTPRVDVISELKRRLDGKRIVFDVSDSGAMYFFGGFTPVSSITEPAMSIWLRSDYLRWQKQILSGEPDCLVTSPTTGSDPMVQWFTQTYRLDPAKDGESFRNYYSIYCRKD